MKARIFRNVLNRITNLTELIAAATLAVGLLQQDLIAVLIGIGFMILMLVFTIMGKE